MRIRKGFFLSANTLQYQEQKQWRRRYRRLFLFLTAGKAAGSKGQEKVVECKNRKVERLLRLL